MEGGGGRSTAEQGGAEQAVASGEFIEPLVLSLVEEKENTHKHG